MPTTGMRTDSLNQFSWFTKTTITDDFGNIISKVTDLDNDDQRVEDTYVDGQPTKISYYDLSEQSSFQSTVETVEIISFPEFGIYFKNVLQRERTWDNGQIEVLDYQNMSALLADPDDTATWDRIARTYDNDADGNLRLVTEEITYDDGTSQFRAYDQGKITSYLRFDADNEVTKGFGYFYDANGNLSQRQIGGNAALSLHIENYSDGRLTSVLEQAVIDDDTYSWLGRLMEYDEAGQISTRTTSFRNEIERTETYVDGVRSETLEEDFGDVMSWDTRVTSFYDGLDFAQRETFFDDGVVREETFLQGQRYELYDNDIANTQPWIVRKIGYDSDGLVSSKITIFDDGRELSEIYAFGQLLSSVERDVGDAMSWHSRETIFGEDGVKTSRTTILDNGVFRRESYEDGQRVQIWDIDTQNTQSWNEKFSTFDANGLITRAGLQFDNGVTLQDSYADGQRVTRLQTDEFDAKSWDTVTKSYDETGSVTQTQTIYDTGDVMIFDYVANQRIDHDVDDSASWLFRVADYGPDNSRVFTIYDTIEDTPDEILADFGIF